MSDTPSVNDQLIDHESRIATLEGILLDQSGLGMLAYYSPDLGEEFDEDSPLWQLGNYVYHLSVSNALGESFWQDGKRIIEKAIELGIVVKVEPGEQVS